MTPDHQQTIENTLQLAYARTIELTNMFAIPQGKNPPSYTRDMLWNCPLAHDLQAVASYIEGYQVQEDITITLQRATRTLFGHTLSQQGIRLPLKFHKTPLGKMMFLAFERYFPATAWMTTAEVQKLFSVKRQTVYDWAEEGKLAPYYVGGKQVYLRSQIEKFHAAWMQQKQRQQQHKGIVKQL
jgi:excisionase family DNA binding protein